jgi:hypothetical protein
MPGIDISGMCSRPSKTTCSQTSSQIATLSNSWQNCLGPGIEGAAQHFLRKPPMWRLEPEQPRDAAGLADDRQIGIIDRLEHDHFVARLDDGEDRAGQSLGAARGHHHFRHGIELEAVPMAVMGRDRLPQFRDAHHGRILVVAVQGGVGRGLPDVRGSRIVRKALAEIDGVVVACKLRHRLEDGDGEVREDLVVGDHGDISRLPWSAVLPPSSR